MDASDEKKVFVFYLKGEPRPQKASNILQSPCGSVSNSIERCVELPSTGSTKVPALCRCAKSRCLRLKCSCFVNGRVCGPECECFNFLNRSEHQSLREEAANLNRRIFNNAFRKVQVIEVDGRRVLDSGCRCRLSGCRNNYCQCVRSGAECSELCACHLCDHSKVRVGVMLAKKMPQKNRRRRLRLVINEKTSHEQKATPGDFLLLEKV